MKWKNEIKAGSFKTLVRNLRKKKDEKFLFIVKIAKK